MMVAFRAEVVIAKWLEKALKQELKWLSNDNVLKRGSTPTVVEWLILGWVVGKSVSHSVKTKSQLPPTFVIKVW